jgi:HK97 family phage major capsid protein
LVWDAAKSAVDVHDNTIVRTFCRDERGNPVEIGREDSRGGDGFGSTPNAGAWRTSDGRELRTVASHQRFAQSSANEYGGLTLGGMVRAALLGPKTEAEARALAEGSGATGGYTVPEPLSQAFIDMARARSAVTRAGAVFFAMTSATQKVARLETDLPCAWRAENAAVTTSDPVFGQVELVAKSLAAYVPVSRELLMDSANLSTLLDTAFAARFAAELDRAALFGTGSSSQPRGVVSTSGIGALVMTGANGSALADWSRLLEMRATLEAANISPTAFISNPRETAALAALAGTDGHYLQAPQWLQNAGWTADPEQPKPLWLTTASVPVNGTLGSSTNCATIVAGDFRELIIGVREGVSIEVHRSPLASNGQLMVICQGRFDVALARPAAFAKLTGIVP